MAVPVLCAPNHLPESPHVPLRWSSMRKMPFCSRSLLSLSVIAKQPPPYNMEPRLPDGFSKISRLYLFEPSGLKIYDFAALQKLIPYFP